MEFKSINSNDIKKSASRMRILSTNLAKPAFVFLISLLIFGCGKKSDLKENLSDHKIATLGDNLELAENGENPLEGNTEAIANGARHYAAMCAVCHGEGAQGNTGPDLLDNAWLHGSDNFSIYNIMMNGVTTENMKMNPPRGKMPPYKNIFGSRRILEIMAWLSDQKKKLKDNPGN